MDLNIINKLVNRAIIRNLNKDLIKDFISKTKFYVEHQPPVLRQDMQAALPNIELFFAQHPRLIPPAHSYFDCEGVFIMLWTQLDLVLWVCISDEPVYSFGARENKATKVLLHDIKFTEPVTTDLQLFFLPEDVEPQ